MRRFEFPLLGIALTVLGGCSAALNLTPSDADSVLTRQLLRAPSPAQRGRYAVQRLYYGSGTDKRRPEFRDSVRLTTQTVDASKLVDLGERAKSRNRYWGFTPKAFPINGRVWYPDGPGPFPLVLIVHGNHNMKDFSDPGYGYLGELLASRGFILVSVDMNFVNGSIRGENDARGWLLLQHLAAWRDFVASDTNPFYGKADLDRVALIGHSRGGEAVGHAAAFNRLSHYPDDATVKFDFNFGVRSIIAIAPVDGQYQPTGRLVPVRDVNYMVFHGSHDGDVSAFMGLRLYHRLAFTGGGPYLKTAIYMYRANHGQWNTVWGNKDSGRRSGRSLELRGLVPPEDQRRFAEVYITAFLEATLRDDERYLPLFRDHRLIGEWLPKTMYVTRFQTSGFRPLATYEEDIDVTTGTEDGIELRGDSLSTWKENRLSLRWQNSTGTQENQGVWLGWNNRVAGKGDSAIATPASYTMTLPPGLAGAWRVDAATTLDLVLAPTNDEPKPRKAAEDSTEQEEQQERQERQEQEERRERQSGDKEKPPIDLTVMVRDADGDSAAVPLSRYGAIRRPLEIKVYRRNDKRRFTNQWELVLQSYSIPLEDFRAVNSAIDLASLREVRLVFDRTPVGTVVLDDVGFSRLDPAFLAVRW